MELLDYLAQNNTAFTITSLILGLMVGSFLNVVIHRLPRMLEQEWRAQCADFLDQAQDPAATEKYNLVTPDSHCPHCGHKIRAWENIPVLSYIFLRGRCSHCQGKISIRYPIIELVTGVLTAACAWHFGYGLPAVAAMLLTWCLICLTMIDFDHKLLPDIITLPILWLGMLLNLRNTYTDIESSILGATVGYLVLWLLYHVFRILTGKEGMGYGDFKLLALLGAWMGWQYLLPIVLLSSLVGALVGITLIVAMGRDRQIPIPFGPYLASAGWITLFWGKDIIAWYMGFSGLASPA